MPPSNAEQTVEILEKTLPAKGEMNKDALYGNEILSFEAAANKEGEVPFAIKYRVTRKEVTNPLAEKDAPDRSAAAAGRKSAHRAASRSSCIKDKELPKDQTGGGPAVLRRGQRPHEVQQGRHGLGPGRLGLGLRQQASATAPTSTACSSRWRGPTRSRPSSRSASPCRRSAAKARFRGYHCWAKFKPDGKGWIPVDISEANKNPKLKDYYFGNLTADRVAFSTGRDIDLVPKQAGPPLNFFVYPYVEVDGKPYDECAASFTFKDVAEKDKK